MSLQVTLKAIRLKRVWGQGGWREEQAKTKQFQFVVTYLWSGKEGPKSLATWRFLVTLEKG